MYWKCSTTKIKKLKWHVRHRRRGQPAGTTNKTNHKPHSTSNKTTATAMHLHLHHLCLSQSQPIERASNQ
jgi:hypothetical protein